MSYQNQGNAPRVSVDRFGNKFQLKTALEVVNKKSGEIIEGAFSCYVELGGKLYKIEVSPRQKETKSGRNGMWVKVTAKVKRAATSGSM